MGRRRTGQEIRASRNHGSGNGVSAQEEGIWSEEELAAVQREASPGCRGSLE